jgi:Protein of unknown function (DUF2778)
LLRVSGGPLAAGVAAFATGFIFHIWLTADGRPATAVPGVTAGVSGDVMAGTDAKLRARSEAGRGAEFALRWPQQASDPATPQASFGERFAFDPPSGEPARALASFDDRFGNAATTSSATVRSAATAASPRATVARAAKAIPAPRVTAEGARKPAPKMQLASASATSLPLAYAPDEKANDLGLIDRAKGPAAKDADPFAGLDANRTAVYEITSRTVYMPNGRRLEAHSGLGSHMDDPSYVAVRMTGPTPPNVYTLRMREALFHGVRAIRLLPKDESKMNGRAGILAHSYMLGASGQSNGCVSFADYPAFLEAYERGDVTHLVVVERLADVPVALRPTSDWLSGVFGGIFRRS